MSTSPNSAVAMRHDWTTDEARTLFELPLNDLLFRAQAAHRRFFDPNIVQMSNLLSVKTGGCPEDCGYCPQSAKFDTGTKAEKLMDVEERFQMWRFKHLSVVKRIIGFKMGTGGSSGVPFLQKALSLCFFPELWDVRTQLKPRETE